MKITSLDTDTLKPDQSVQLPRAVTESLSQINARDIRAIKGRGHTRRSTQAAAEVQHLVTGLDIETVQKLPSRRPAAKMHLIDGMKIRFGDAVPAEAGCFKDCDQPVRQPVRAIVRGNVRQIAHGRASPRFQIRGAG